MTPERSAQTRDATEDDERCPECDEPLEVGDVLYWDGDEWVCETCWECT